MNARIFTMRGLYACVGSQIGRLFQADAALESPAVCCALRYGPIRAPCRISGDNIEYQ
jgi:hypothetical protein